MTYLRRIEDMVSSNDDLDMPQEWLAGDRLEPRQRPRDRISGQRRAPGDEDRAQAAILLGSSRAWDNEPASIFVQPDYQWC
jgi:hypothetical protein